MTYSPTTPPGKLSPSATQAQIQTNFSQYALKFAVNHTAINNDNQGDHEAVILENQSAGPTIKDNLVAFFCKGANSALGAQPQLFAKIKKFLPTALDTTNPLNTAMQLTYNTVNTAGPQFQSFLPGGLLLFSGSTNNIAVPITLSPSTSFLFCAIAIPTNLNGGVPNNVSTTITQPNIFKIDSTSAVAGNVFYWIAIGTA